MKLILTTLLYAKMMFMLFEFLNFIFFSCYMLLQTLLLAKILNSETKTCFKTTRIAKEHF